MIIATDPAGRRRTAAPALEGPSLCPDCGAELVVRLCRDRVPHFAHRPGQRCNAAAARAARRAAARQRARARAAGEIDGQETLFSLEEPGSPE